MLHRVAYFINQYPKVSHSFIRREILALERQGFEVQRIALRGWDGELVDAEDLRERGRTRYVLRGGVMALLLVTLRAVLTKPGRFYSAMRLALRMGRHADRTWPFHFVYLAEACRILPWLREFGTQHVHAHFGTNSAEVVLLAHALGGPPYSFTVHGPEEYDKPQFIHLGEKIRRSAFVVAISSYGRSQLYRWVEQDQWHKVKVVHCGLEKAFYEGGRGGDHVGSGRSPRAFGPRDDEEVGGPYVDEGVDRARDDGVGGSPRRFAPRDDGVGGEGDCRALLAMTGGGVPRLVCVGRLCEQKGQLLLVEAAGRLAGRGLDFELVLAGDGEMRPQVEALIAELGLGERVRITGWISSCQVRDEILAARALVLPSFAEGLPVVIMEAMALRRPVLSTYVAGIPELVRPGENGWLFPAGDVEALVEAMADCLAQPDEVLARMGEAGYRRVLERHDIDTEAAKLAELFAKSMGNPTAPVSGSIVV